MFMTGIAMAAAAGAACDKDFAQYNVAYVGERQFDIEATFETPQTDFLLWIYPTDERPEGQSESIRNLEAFDDAGAQTAIDYEGEGDWKAAAGASKITYRLIADHDEIKWPYGADEVGHPFGGGYYFAGTAFFVGPNDDKTVCPVSVHFNIPDEWTLTAPWANGGHDGKAFDMDDLQDNGFAVGPFKQSTQQVSELKVTSVYDPRLSDVAKPFAEGLLNDLMPAYSRYFGGEPAATYSTFHFGYGNSDGSAFNRSFTMQYEVPLNEVERPLWAHGLAHETMHLWTGVVVRVDGEIEWFTEGFTDYLSVKHLYREGYLDDEGLRNEIASFIVRHQLGKRMSQGTGLREAGASKGQNWFLIYGSGALIALMLDAEMSHDDPAAFDKMMAQLYSAGSRTYTFDQLMAFMDERSDGKASEIFNAVDQGLRPNVVNAWLKPAGVGVAGMNDRTFVEFQKACSKPRGCTPAFLAGK